MPGETKGVEGDGSRPLVDVDQPEGGGRRREAGDGVGNSASRVGGSVGFRRRGPGVHDRLGAGSSGDVAGGAGSNGIKELGVPSAGLALPAPPEVATSGYEEASHQDSEDGGQPGAETGPVDVDKRKPVVRLVQGNIIGLVGDKVADGEVGFIFKVEGRDSGISGGGRRTLPLDNELLGPDIIEDGLSIAEQGHFKEDEEGMMGVCSTAELTRD